ncbi:MAG: prolipoprotein diacylglyceryl transferase [Lentisphaeraceae bacterium]|nr:prolipoprotein diacylglyceryl transferase [Lentisphaeraceae bacterium]
MNSHLFELLGTNIRTSGLLNALGIFLAFFLMNRRSKILVEHYHKLAGVLFISVFAGLIGARALYVLRNWQNEFAGNLLNAFDFTRGGVVFQGGFSIGIVCFLCLCRRNKINIPRSLDALAPSLALAHAFGRLGCYYNGCCFGAICGTDVGVRFPQNSLVYIHQMKTIPHLLFQGTIFPLESLAVYPTQLYSAVANFLICGLLIIFTFKLKTKGHLFSLYLMLYGGWRIAIEFFRDDQSRHFGLSLAQYIAILQMIVGIVLWLYFIRINKEEVVANGRCAN